MSVTLCLDFGNTRLKGAIFINDTLTTVVPLADDSVPTILHLLDTYQPSHSILSSVIQHDEAIIDLLTKKTSFHLLNHQSKLPITTPIGKPATIGSDRLAICSAAVHLFPQQHNLAIGLGTCVTYNYINPFNAFLGGAISPGMHMRFKAMHEQTAKLPLVQADSNFPLIGYDTRTNLLSGVLMGLAKEIDGMIDAYSEKFSNLKVSMTGGDMNFFKSYLKNPVYTDEDLLFKGLLYINRLNNP
ncbi:MAG: type III pantothenate kinase [Sphingobacteriales bacterium]|uniref:type III pantothenate kinase n=1 Tax=Hydrotalea flava TaxID=714549 RepID=UPI000837A8F4|nr:type III pantothenate kinase [Hydrotalea flava]RTL56938.1 MAG: type III pantothenate kinase [Sphingobacteriales bacterium]